MTPSARVHEVARGAAMPLPVYAAGRPTRRPALRVPSSSNVGGRPRRSPVRVHVSLSPPSGGLRSRFRIREAGGAEMRQIPPVSQRLCVRTSRSPGRGSEQAVEVRTSCGGNVVHDARLVHEPHPPLCVPTFLAGTTCRRSRSRFAVMGSSRSTRPLSGRADFRMNDPAPPVRQGGTAMAARVQSVQVTTADQLQQAVSSYIVQGYSVANQTATSATMVKRKEFSVLWVVVGLILGVLPLRSDPIVRWRTPRRTRPPGTPAARWRSGYRRSWPPRRSRTPRSGCAATGPSTPPGRCSRT